ncbi:MAG TPA: 6-bladed beta-propeller [Longimicrobiales bacterium]|nr:6-bladed beta-propeller [Longimicrobiales bacterium]
MRSVIAALLLILAPAAAAAQAAPFRLEPVTRIGCAECDGPEMFTRVMGLGVWDGRVYVLDQTAPMVRVFDAAGHPVRVFGRTGDGPGELRMPMRIFPREDRGVDVYDMQQMRITSFDSIGNQTGNAPLRAGLFVRLAAAPRSDFTYYTPLRPDRTDQPVMRLARGSDTPEEFTVLTPNIPTARTDEITHAPILAARPAGGIAIGYGHEAYQIRVFDEQGSFVRDIVRNVSRPRKTEKEIAKEQAAREMSIGRLSAMVTEAGHDPPRLSVSVDEERRHFTDLQFDAAGRLWVQTERGSPDSTIFDVFDPGGEYLGGVSLPTRINSFALGDDLLAAPMSDDDGIHYIAVWRVR